MTYQSDPTRWTQSHGDAPELLRSAFDAGTREGPSDLQMRALALKLAAVGGGAAIAAGASTAHASATAGGGALASGGGAFTLTKIAVSLALIGAAATGTVLWQRSETSSTLARQTAQQVSSQHAEQAVAPSVAPGSAGSVSAAARGESEQPTPAQAVAAPELAPTPAAPAVLAEGPSPAVEADPVVVDTGTKAASEARQARSVRRSERHAARNDTAVSSPNAARSGDSVAVERVSGQRQQMSEIDLLRSARSALAARPREAYRLTEEHRSQYPQGVFTQERDALAVEALVRAGELKLARELAEVFVKRYPSSPHAHRFRESMKLP